MNSTVVYRRTPKGEQEISRRSLPYEPWLTLVMVDGKSSAADLASLKPELPDVARSLERLLREGYIDVISAPLTPMTVVPRKEPETPLASWARDEDGSPGFNLSGFAARSARWVLVFLPFLAVGAALLVIHESFERFTSRVDDALATQLGEVSIGSQSIVFTPRPALRLTELSVGRSLRVREVVLRPGWSTLFGRSQSIEVLALREATLTAADLVALLQSGNLPLAPKELRTGRVTLVASRLDLDGSVTAPLAGEFSYAPDGKLERATLSLDDGKALATIVASAVELSARNWSTPTVPTVTFEQLDVSGNLESGRLVLDRVEAMLHDGLLKGDVVLDWNVGLFVEGRFSAANLDVQTLIGGFTRDFSLGGRLDAEGSFTARAPSAATLIDNLGVGADFRVKRGVLYNADVSAAAVGHTRGGTTQFEELTGNVQTAGRSFSFRRLQLGSSLLTAKGSLDVTPSRQIMGRFSVRLKSDGDGASTISVGGSLTEPKLQLDG